MSNAILGEAPQTEKDVMNFRGEPMYRESIWSLSLALCLIAVGFAGLVLPHPLGMGVATLLSWIVLFAGIAHLLISWRSWKTGQALGRIIIGIAYVAGAVYLLADPELSISAITRLFAVVLFIEGIVLVTTYLRNRMGAGAIWILIDGIATFAFAALIWTGGPDGTLWTVGTVLGANILVSGVAALIISFTAPSRGFESGRAGHRRSMKARLMRRRP
jgi:uncharacterized membrane protein HdeD (DUF308 family)